jgi:hypothetical protein
MCAGDDKNCPEFELHHRKFKETLDRERRSFLRSSFAAAGGPITICLRMPTQCIGAISARS